MSWKENSDCSKIWLSAVVIDKTLFTFYSETFEYYLDNTVFDVLYVLKTVIGSFEISYAFVNKMSASQKIRFSFSFSLSIWTWFLCNFHRKMGALETFFVSYMCEKVISLFEPLLAFW